VSCRFACAACARATAVSVRLAAALACGRWAAGYCESAAGLVVLLALLRLSNPLAYHVLQCLAAAVPVACGYAETRRSVALGACAAHP
jgi:hypothetical protein